MRTDTGSMKFLANTDAVIGDYSDIGTDRSSKETPLLGDGTLFTNRIDGTLEILKTNVEPIAQLTQMVREAELFDQVGRPNLSLHSALEKQLGHYDPAPWDQAAFNAFKAVRSYLDEEAPRRLKAKDGTPDYYQYYGAPETVNRKSNDRDTISKQWLDAMGFRFQATEPSQQVSRQIGLDNTSRELLLKKTGHGLTSYWYNGDPVRQLNPVHA